MTQVTITLTFKIIVSYFGSAYLFEAKLKDLWPKIGYVTI